MEGFSINNHKKSEILIVVLAIILYLFRTAIPVFKIPFFLVFTILIVYSLVNYRMDLKITLINFVNVFRLPLLMAVILTLAFVFSDKFYVEIFKDVSNVVILFSLFLCSSVLIKNEADLYTYFKTLISLIIIFATIISFKFFFDLLEIRFADSVISTTQSVDIEEIQEIDINFGILPLIFGIIAVFYLRVRSNSIPVKIIYSLLLLFFFVCVLAMGSRRGIVFLGTFSTVLIFSLFIPFFNPSKIFKLIRRNAIHFVISVLLFFLVLILLTNNTSYIFKNEVLELIGSRDITKAKNNITQVITRYMLVFDNHYFYKKLYSDTFFTPKDPDSGWGTRVHKTIYPLTGINSEIIPPMTKGYFMDSTCNSDSRSGNAYSYTAISSYYVKKNKTLEASVFCYVSQDFDGTWAMLTAEGAIDGRKESEYNIMNKGTWQKLELLVKSTGGICNFYLYFSKFGVNDFSTLKGYVIYAYPEVKEVKTMNDSLTVSDFLTTTKKVSSDPGMKNYHYSCLLPGTLSSLSHFNKQDLVRKWFYRVFTEDSTYHPYHKNLNVDTTSISFIAGRLVRWRFAWKIYTQEYDWRQRIMGGGFNFLNWYGYYFLRDKTKSDWPHNPFFSILLYSGIIGLVLFIYLLYKTFLYYLKYVKEYYILFIFFLITFFFSFFSGGSPFDPPMMGFFILLPFFLHSIHIKDNTSVTDT